MINKFFVFAIICSICSQLPFLWETSVGLFMKLTWLFPLFMILCKTKYLKVNPAFVAILCTFLIFLSYCLLCQVVTGISYFGGDARNMVISFMTAFVSMIYWKDYGNLIMLKKIGLYIYITTAILAIYVYMAYYKGADLTGEYAYVAKNSFAYLLLGAIIFSYSVFSLNNKRTKLLVNSISFLLSIIIVVSRSRAVLLGLFFLILYYAIKVKSKLILFSFIIISVSIVSVLIINEELFDLIIYGMFLGTDDITDINKLSTGREDVFQTGFKLFLDSPWIGIGRFYFDCMPLAVVFQYGLLGSTFYFIIIYLTFRIIRMAKKTKELYLTTKLLFFTLIINSLFEAYPPFGPGAKCFMLWMMLGFCLGGQLKKKSNKVIYGSSNHQPAKDCRSSWKSVNY